MMSAVQGKRGEVHSYLNPKEKISFERIQRCITEAFAHLKEGIHTAFHSERVQEITRSVKRAFEFIGKYILSPLITVAVIVLLGVQIPFWGFVIFTAALIYALVNAPYLPRRNLQGNVRQQQEPRELVSSSISLAEQWKHIAVDSNENLKKLVEEENELSYSLVTFKIFHHYIFEQEPAAPLPGIFVRSQIGPSGQRKAPLDLKIQQLQSGEFRTFTLSLEEKQKLSPYILQVFEGVLSMREEEGAADLSALVNKLRLTSAEKSQVMAIYSEVYGLSIEATQSREWLSGLSKLYNLC